MEASAEIVPFARGDVAASKGEYTEAIQLWMKTKAVAETLSKDEIGALQGMRRMDALRKSTLYILAEYYRAHQRADVAPGVAVAIAILSDNDQGSASVSQQKLAALFGRSRTAIAEAQSRLREDGLIKTTRGRYAASYPVVPRAMAQNYNHTVWLVDAICTQDASVNCQDAPVNCQLSSPAGQLNQMPAGTGQLESVNCQVEGNSIAKPALHNFTKNNSTTLHKAASVVAAGIATAFGALPAAADPPAPPAIIEPTRPISQSELSHRLFEAAGNALNRTVPTLEVMAMPRGWLESGCDLELDILPTVRALASRRPPQSISSWKFFASAIADAKASRTAPMPAGNARPKSQASNWHDEQERALNFLFRK